MGGVVMWMAGLFFFLLGIIFMIVSPINRKKNARCSAQAQGKLTDIRRRKRGFWYFYSYEVNGNRYEVRSTNSSPEANEIGDTCTIWYDPAKPEDSQPFRYESDKVYRIILIIGIVSLLLGMFLIFLDIVK